METFKAFKQSYSPSPEVLNLLDAFRKMVNDCIRIGLAENVTSMKALSKKAYQELAMYPVTKSTADVTEPAIDAIIRTYHN